METGETMDISQRKKLILRAIVESYVETAEPVGSKSICTDLGLSSATIRNEMAELTALGLLEQPHTSAGRIPSSKGYRIYVNELMNDRRLSAQETMELNSALKQRINKLDSLLEDAGRLVAEFTHYPVYALTSGMAGAKIRRFDFIYVDKNTLIVVVMLDNDSVKNKLLHFPEGIDDVMVRKLSTVFNSGFTGLESSEITHELVAACERACGDTEGVVASVAGFAISALEESAPRHAHLSGAARILEHPEYRDPDKAQRILSYLSDDAELLKLPAPEDDNEVKILIGPENIAEELSDSSVVVASYELGHDMKGLIGVVGPTRMDYARVSAHLSYLARGLKLLLGGSDDLPQLGSGPPGSPPEQR